MNRASGQCGYTLLELLAALGVIALLAGLIPSLFKTFLPGVELKAAADEIRAELVEIRTDARLRGEVLILPEENLEREGFEVRLEAHPEIDEGDLEGIAFYANGRTSGGVIRISKKGRERALVVDWLTGRVTEAGDG